MNRVVKSWIQGRMALIISSLFFTGFFYSCTSKKPLNDQSVVMTDTLVSDDEKIEVKYAKGFNVSYFPGYKILSVIDPFVASPDTIKYLLVKRGDLRPSGFESSIVIETPVTKMIAMSSVHVGLLEFLESSDVLAGLENLNYIYSEAINNAYKAGKIVEVGRNMSPDYEKIIELQPDVVMGVGGAGPSQYHQLKAAGLPVLINSEWVETTPLAKAEWVKLMAVLFNKEKLVNDKFVKIENEYNRLKALASQPASKPKILTGINLKDVWYMPNGQNYMSVFFNDAGADYSLSNAKGSGSSALSFEAIYPMAMEAVCWVNLGGVNLHTKKDLLSQDSRYGDFKAFKENSVYDYTNRINSSGANDFWESAGVRPDLVLADLIKILHPDLLPDHQLYYYKQLL